MLRGLMRASLARTFRHDLPVPTQRRRLEALNRLTLVPRDVRFDTGDCGGVPGEWVMAHPASAADTHALLYLHGGAYCVGSPRTHRAITGRLARLTGARVFAADYRLAPEHVFPSAVEDGIAAYRGLLARGYRSSRIAIAGDSAGGGLALAVATALRGLGDELPAALVVFSPWVDLGDPDRGAVPAGEVMISPPWIHACARLYLAGCDSRDPRASPIHADLAGLPPTLIQVGRDEVLLADARRLDAALAGAGVASTMEEYPRRWHVFQASAGVLADADRALAATATFVRRQWRGVA
jgi:acetyl esterase/lipase